MVQNKDGNLNKCLMNSNIRVKDNYYMKIGKIFKTETKSLNVGLSDNTKSLTVVVVGSPYPTAKIITTVRKILNPPLINKLAYLGSNIANIINQHQAFSLTSSLDRLNINIHNA